MSRKPKRQRVMQFSVLQRLAICNSPRLPQYIEIIEEREVRAKGKKKWRTEKVSHFQHWVGIGWLDTERKDAVNPVLIVEDKE